MKIKHLFFVAFIFLVACQSEEGKLQAQIESLQKALETNADEQQVNQLLTLYEQYRTSYPDQQFIEDEAALLSRVGKHREAVEVLLNAMQDQPTPENLLMLAAILEEKLEAYEAARTVYQIAGEQFPDNEQIKNKISTEWVALTVRMEQLRGQVFNEETGRIDQRAAQDFLYAVEVQTALRGNDPQTPGLLFEAADVAGAIRNYEKALAIFERIYTDYPNYNKAAEALFMQAFTLDSELRRLDEAKVAYELFLEKYPNHELASSAKFSLENLGKSEEEIIQEFLKKQQESE